MKREQLSELVYQMLETERGGHSGLRDGSVLRCQ
jgi:hypothetical protein